MSKSEPTKCEFCGIDTKSPSKCDFCKAHFCESHHLPQNHRCIEISKLMQEARIALLQHFSSKSSHQAIIILTLVLALFSFVQAMLPSLHSPIALSEVDVFFMLIVWGAVSLAIRAIGRLLWYGQLADAVLTVESASKKEVSDVVKKDQVPRAAIAADKNHSKIELEPTYLKRLEWSCGLHAKRHLRHFTMPIQWRFVFFLAHETPLQVSALVVISFVLYVWKEISLWMTIIFLLAFGAMVLSMVYKYSSSLRALYIAEKDGTMLFRKRK